MSVSKELYQSLLDRFCSEDDLRPMLKKPFFDGKDICASDCIWLIRINPEACGLELPITPPKRIEVKHTKPIQVCVKDIVSAISHADYEDETIEIEPAVSCTECDGFGVVEFEYRSKDFTSYYKDCDCPICDGSGNIREAIVRKTGRKIPLPQEPIAINGTKFDAYRLFVICDVCSRIGAETITITALNKNDACAFQLNDDCEIVLMPIGGYYTDEPKFDLKVK